MPLYLFFLLILNAFTACQNNNATSSAIVTNKQPIDTVVGKKLNIPTNLQAYSPFSGYLLDSNQLKHFSSMKIYSYVNVSCPSCIGSLETWKKLIPEFMKSDVPVILICRTEDNFEYIKFRCENGSVKNFPFPFYFDAKQQYIKQNPFIKEYGAYQTVLTDKDNNILLTGDLVHSTETKDLYLTEIRKRKSILVSKNN